jgi:alkylation response protein AidB-like acyl-CoA dehydrogenase
LESTLGDERRKIDSPNATGLVELCNQLRSRSIELASARDWPEHQLRLCSEFGLFEWFVPPEFGGQAWTERALAEAYLQLSASCLTTSFVITQWVAACKRIVVSENSNAKQRWLPRLAQGDLFATVGISQLTTSRRHLKQAALRATATSEGFILNGFTPWVTGAPFADLIVVGATLDDQKQVLLSIPAKLPGVSIPPAPELVALSASQTGEVHFREVFVANEFLLAGPADNVMSIGTVSGSGGWQTSALALGLSHSAISFVEQEAALRTELAETVRPLREQWNRARDRLFQKVEGIDICTNDQLRHDANELALRSTQFSLAIAKGTGFVNTHPVGRWCREALFFLVWSCPQPVLQAHLCDLAAFD